MSRPEHVAPPEVYYNLETAAKYASNSRMINIQSKMSERAIELLLLPDSPCMILDIGCGSGISGGVLQEHGHHWVGFDISPAMLEVAVERECEGDLILNDAGQGFNFRPGTFDGAISISAIQWLMNCDTKSANPIKRLRKFFQSLFNCLVRGGRAVLQFYPETPGQVETITSAAMRCGFGGGLVVDYPNSTKAKKYFLVLYAGSVGKAQKLPPGLEEEKEEIAVEGRSSKRRKTGKAAHVSDKDRTLEQKERHRRQGKQVCGDSKYTGRKRKLTF